MNATKKYNATTEDDIQNKKKMINNPFVLVIVLGLMLASLLIVLTYLPIGNKAKKVELEKTNTKIEELDISINKELAKADSLKIVYGEQGSEADIHELIAYKLRIIRDDLNKAKEEFRRGEINAEQMDSIYTKQQELQKQAFKITKDDFK